VVSKPLESAARRRPAHERRLDDVLSLDCFIVPETGADEVALIMDAVLGGRRPRRRAEVP